VVEVRQVPSGRWGFWRSEHVHDQRGSDRIDGGVSARRDGKHRQHRDYGERRIPDQTGFEKPFDSVHKPSLLEAALGQMAQQYLA
jgi:hypothetical protein